MGIPRDYLRRDHVSYSTTSFGISLLTHHTSHDSFRKLIWDLRQSTADGGRHGSDATSTYMYHVILQTAHCVLVCTLDLQLLRNAADGTLSFVLH